MSNLLPTVWRPTRAARWGAGAAVGFWVLFGGIVLAAGIARGSAAEATSGAVLAVLSAVLFARITLRPRIEVSDGELLIVNPWRTVRVELVRIVGAAPGYRGIAVLYEAGGGTRSVDAWAVQKANLSTWRKAHTRADAVAVAIMAAANAAKRST